MLACGSKGEACGTSMAQTTLGWAKKTEDWIRPSATWATFFVALWKYTLLSFLALQMNTMAQREHTPTPMPEPAEWKVYDWMLTTVGLPLPALP
jgi:hypothetical protein